MITLSLFDTFLSTLPLIIAILLYNWKLNHSSDIIIACARMVLQLLVVGYLLTFLFDFNSSGLGLAVLCFITLVSAAIAIRPLKKRNWHTFGVAATALFIGGGVHLAWIILAVLKLSPWYQPQLVIPLAGMVFANGMNALSLGAERYQSELEQGRDNPIATAFNAAMIPQVNALLAVGLVSLPGMMTGQILSGISPLEAVRYQIMIMSMVAGTSALCLTLYFRLIERSAKREQ